MFILAKILSNSNYSVDAHLMPVRRTGILRKGAPVAYNGTELQSPTTSLPPTHIMLEDSTLAPRGLARCYAISKDMVFKVRYNSTTPPHIGMLVGASTYKHALDCVAPKENGYCVIIGIDDKPNIVYVRFIK